jgi:LuxR family maltose regulon positive regulatory protein
MPGVETGVRSQPLTNDRAFVLADRAAVTPLADQASQIIDRHLAACIVASHIEPAAARLGDPVVASPYRVPLTAAELKVLRYLPTNLTFDRVAERLYVSRNTVKSHVAAVYRKLGVSCRHDAVERARIVGLLDDDHHTAE